MNPAVKAFVEAINEHAVDKLALLMTDDHVFLDSMGARHAGRELMRTAWATYFGMIEDYRVEVRECYEDGGRVVLIGVAAGAYRGERWEVPAAWRAEVRGRQIADWRVYCDNEPVRQLMEKHK
jgi:ketosteroid isomerase-like protein